MEALFFEPVNEVNKTKSTIEMLWSTLTSLSNRLEMAEAKITKLAALNDITMPSTISDAQAAAADLQSKLAANEFEKLLRANLPILKRENINENKIRWSFPLTSQLDNRFEALMTVLKMHLLMQVRQSNTTQLSKHSAQKLQHLEQRLEAISGNTELLQEKQIETQSLLDILCSNSITLSRFQQLELLVKIKSNCIEMTDQYKIVIDILAENSISSDKFSQMEDCVTLLDRKYDKMLKSTEQHRQAIKYILAKLEELDTKSQQLQAFIDEAKRVDDPALRHGLDSQQAIVETMQRELDGHKTLNRDLMSAELENLKETLADAAINAILANKNSCVTIPIASDPSVSTNNSVPSLVNNTTVSLPNTCTPTSNASAMSHVAGKPLGKTASVVNPVRNAPARKVPAVFPTTPTSTNSASSPAASTAGAATRSDGTAEAVTDSATLDMVSAAFKRDVTLNNYELQHESIDILSVSGDGELLLGTRATSLRRLYIFNRNGKHVSSIEMFAYDALVDATWTQQGNIVCTTKCNGCSSKIGDRVVTMTRDGDLIAESVKDGAQNLSVYGAKRVIYLACARQRVYQTQDDGRTWTLVYAVSSNARDLLHVVRVPSDFKSDVFWAIGLAAGSRFLRVYTMDGGGTNVKSHDVADRLKHPFSSCPCKMAHDGRTTMFVTEQADSNVIHVFSTNQPHAYKLDLSRFLKDEHIRLVAFDCRRRELYLTLTVPGKMKVFKFGAMDDL